MLLILLVPKGPHVYSIQTGNMALRRSAMFGAAGYKHAAALRPDPQLNNTLLPEYTTENDQTTDGEFVLECP